MDTPGLPDFDDEPTIVELRESFVEPPPLPFSLRRAVRRPEDDAWLRALPEEARRVLEEARYPVESWPRRERLLGAVAIPVCPIPSLSRHA